MTAAAFATCTRHGRRTVSLMAQDEATGPVQLSMFTFTGPQLPAEMRRVLDDLRDENIQGLRLIDALVLRKNTDGTITRKPSPDPIAEIEGRGLISKLLDRAQAQATLATSPSPTGTYEATTGRGSIFSGERMPDPRDTVPTGFQALALLIEHRWATPIHEAVLHSNATPVGNAWIGVEALYELGLISRETAAELAHA